MRGIAALAFLSLSCSFAADMTAVKSEPNLERRSQKALLEAEVQIKAARDAYAKGEMDAYSKHLEAVRELGELAYQSLQDTGKSARNRPKYWKRAEKKLRELYRDLDSLEKDVSLQDRDVVAAVEKRLNEIHDQIVVDIMTKK